MPLLFSGPRAATPRAQWLLHDLCTHHTRQETSAQFPRLSQDLSCFLAVEDRPKAGDPAAGFCVCVESTPDGHACFVHACDTTPLSTRPDCGVEPGSQSSGASSHSPPGSQPEQLLAPGKGLGEGDAFTYNSQGFSLVSLLSSSSSVFHFWFFKTRSCYVFQADLEL